MSRLARALTRALAAVGRKVYAVDPAPVRKAPDAAHPGHPDHAAAVEAYMTRQVDPDAALTDAERDTLRLAAATGVIRPPLPRRQPAWADRTPRGVQRRQVCEAAEIAYLQSDADGMKKAHHALLQHATHGPSITDVLADEASAYLEGEVR